MLIHNEKYRYQQNTYSRCFTLRSWFCWLMFSSPWRTIKPEHFVVADHSIQSVLQPRCTATACIANPHVDGTRSCFRFILHYCLIMLEYWWLKVRSWCLGIISRIPHGVCQMFVSLYRCGFGWFVSNKAYKLLQTPNWLANHHVENQCRVSSKRMNGGSAMKSSDSPVYFDLQDDVVRPTKKTIPDNSPDTGCTEPP